jgi:hypothetical protein
MFRKIERIIMFDAQLEMSFGTMPATVGKTQPRANRAQWWFARMRQVVDRAMDWQPIPPARPEQIWLPEPRRGAAGTRNLLLPAEKE